MLTSTPRSRARPRMLRTRSCITAAAMNILPAEPEHRGPPEVKSENKTSGVYPVPGFYCVLWESRCPSSGIIWWDLTADRLDPVLLTVSVYERSSPTSAIELRQCEKADALRRISFARLYSRNSSSSSFIRTRSSVVSPPRLPLSTSTYRTHFRSVSGEQSILLDIDTIADHSEPYSPVFS